MPEPLIEIVKGTINDYKIEVSVIREGNSLDVENFEYTRKYLGRTQYYILHEVPDNAVLDIKILNTKLKKNKASRLYLVVNKKFKFASIVNKENDAIGFYGAFAKGKKSKYDESLYEYRVYKPRIIT